METTTIYILALFIGGIIGIISLAAKRTPNKETLKSNSLKDIESRVMISNCDILINNDINLRNIDIEIRPIIKLEEERPEIRIYENNVLIKSFVIEPRNDKPNLNGRYFHSSIRVNSNSSVQIDGYLSNDFSKIDDSKEGIRFQPFFLSDKNDFNLSLSGKGMFQRGLHYGGIISSGDMRLLCICDACQTSFSVEFYHAGFSEVQYFYSSNSKETLLVPYLNNLGNVPHQLQAQIDENELKELEQKLPISSDGTFNYYNSFRCPHCNFKYINFEKNKEIRPNEYYVNYYINTKPRTI